MKNIKYCILTIIILFTGTLYSQTQNKDDERALLKQVINENREAVNAIAMYPRDTRKIIFTASEYPELVTKLSAMQKNTQEAFEKLIANFSKEEQEKIWNLTRYTGLISEIAADHKKSEDEIKVIITKYPDEIRKTALEEGVKNYELLIQIDNMNKSYDADLDQILADYPQEAKDAFRQMINMPEVLDILFDHMQYTVVIGDYYKKNPERVLHKTDSLNQVLTQKNAQEAEEWKQSINDDPQAQQEYAQAANDYAQENGYQQEDYNSQMTPDVTTYNAYPYTWWFGYPSWYPYDYWNPYPYWYDWGFYYGPGGSLVFFGMPSIYFINWYFYYPEHFNRYPELANHYYVYYTNHRAAVNYNPVSNGVNSWKIRNKDVVTSEWDNDKTNRIQRFKEFGKLETERTKYNVAHPHEQIERNEYIKRNQNKYPMITSDVVKNQTTQKISKPKSFQTYTPEETFKRPAVTVPQRYKLNNTAEPNNRQPINQKSQNEYNHSQNINTIKQNQIRNAEQYHENTWHQMQPQSEPIRQQQHQQNYNPPARQENIQQPARQEQHYQQPARQDNPSPSNNRKR